MTATLNSKHQDDALALADDLRPVLHRLYRQLRRETEDLNRGVSPLQNLLLAAIIEHPGIGVADLARIEKLRGPTISGHIKRDWLGAELGHLSFAARRAIRKALGPLSEIGGGSAPRKRR
jgi:hypothetical protein